MNTVYFGKEYSFKEIETALLSVPQETISYFFTQDVEQKVAELLVEGKIIGWFQGRSEFGPRALGNRSILADPRNAQMKNILNERVKFREFFRPFAPAVLWEKQMDYFELGIKNPYMLIVEKTVKEKRAEIPSVNHVDDTGRLQTVCKEVNPKFYSLIEQFYDLTNVPVVLNTSFNVKGEPIVETPTDAVRCFLGTEIDVLCIGDCLVFKKGYER